MNLSDKIALRTFGLLPKKLKGPFAAAALYSETLGPYSKFGLGVIGLVQPINIPTPVDGVLYLYLIQSGYAGIKEDLRERFNGGHIKRRNAQIVHYMSQRHIPATHRAPAPERPRPFEAVEGDDLILTAG